jgi:hypothetical protein
MHFSKKKLSPKKNFVFFSPGISSAVYTPPANVEFCSSMKMKAYVSYVIVFV